MNQASISRSVRRSFTRSGPILWAVLVFFCMPLTAAAVVADTQPPAATAEPMAVDNLLRLTLGLFVVVIAIFVTGWGLRRFGRFNAAAQGGLKVLGGLSMGARERLVLVQVGDQQLLIGVAPGRVQTLHVLDQPIVPEPPVKEDESFARRLRAAIRQRTAS